MDATLSDFMLCRFFYILCFLTFSILFFEILFLLFWWWPNYHVSCVGVGIYLPLSIYVYIYDIFIYFCEYVHVCIHVHKEVRSQCQVSSLVFLYLSFWDSLLLSLQFIDWPYYVNSQWAPDICKLFLLSSTASNTRISDSSHHTCFDLVLESKLKSSCLHGRY